MIEVKTCDNLFRLLAWMMHYGLDLWAPLNCIIDHHLDPIKREVQMRSWIQYSLKMLYFSEIINSNGTKALNLEL